MVSNDDHQTGRLAGSYFKELGSGRVGWCGVKGVRWASQRLKGFPKGCRCPWNGFATFTRSLGWCANSMNRRTRSMARLTGASYRSLLLQ